MFIPNNTPEVNDFRSLYGHVLIKVLTQAGSKNKADEARLLEAWHNGGWNIEFKVEGIDISLPEMAKEWDEQHDRMLGEKAIELVGENLGQVLDNMHGLIDDAEREMRKLLEKKLGVDLRKED